jgi:hypothetical protein
VAEDTHRRRAAVELNALHASGALGDALERARIGDGTPVHDLDGEVLFERLPLTGQGHAGYADVAIHPAMGSILMSVSPDTPWDEAELLEAARRAAGEMLAPDGLPPDATARFVAYSLPKVAVQFRSGDRELAMLDVWSGRPVPPLGDRPVAEGPGHFERWSFLGELSPEDRAAREEAHGRRVEANDAVPGRDRLDVGLIARDQLGPPGEDAPGPGEDDVGGGVGDGGLAPADGGPAGAGGGPAAAVAAQRNLHYSRLDSTHQTCCEKRAQQTDEWCVAASVQMLLDFYRYEYAQDRIASDLGLGTRNAPAPLPNDKWSRVVGEIETLTSNALTVAKVLLDPTAPVAAWQIFRTQILANRPAISFVAGHSRTVGGFFDQAAAGLGFRGLVIYDPYAPGAGPSYEDCTYAIYKCAFTAEVHHV